MGEGNDAVGGPSDEPFSTPLPAPDRIWRHPAERGAEQAAANLAAREAGGRRWPAMLMSFIAGGVVVGLAWLFNEAEPNPIVRTLTQEVAPPTTAEALSGPVAWSDWADAIAESNRSSVVTLHFGSNDKPSVVHGILYADDGHLVAPTHDLAGAADITAALSDGRQMPAELVAADPVSGVAVLKIPSPELAPPTFSTGRVAAGDRLVGIASAEGNSTVREVVVVNTNRIRLLANGAVLSGLYELGDGLDDSWSGAPIVDENGGIIGMAVTTDTGTNAAIPAHDLRHIAAQVLFGNQIAYRSWMGVDIFRATDRLLEERELEGGMVISRVGEGTPAARAGLVAGDIIVGLNTVNVLDSQDLAEALEITSPGDRVELRYSRRMTPEGPQSQDSEPGEISGELSSTTLVLGATARPR